MVQWRSTHCCLLTMAVAVAGGPSEQTRGRGELTKLSRRSTPKRPNHRQRTARAPQARPVLARAERGAIKVHMLGERNSGTNFLDDCLARALADKHRPVANKASFALTPWRDPSGCCQSKHVLHPEVALEQATNRSAHPWRLFIVIARDACQWAEGMYRKPWHRCIQGWCGHDGMPRTCEPSFSAFLRDAWVESNDLTRYSDVLELRRNKSRVFRALTRHSRHEFVSYEALRAAPPAALEPIFRRHHLALRFNWTWCEPQPMTCSRLSLHDRTRIEARTGERCAPCTSAMRRAAEPQKQSNCALKTLSRRAANPNATEVEAMQRKLLTPPTGWLALAIIVSVFACVLCLSSCCSCCSNDAAGLCEAENGAYNPFSAEGLVRRIAEAEKVWPERLKANSARKQPARIRVFL